MHKTKVIKSVSAAALFAATALLLGCSDAKSEHDKCFAKLPRTNADDMKVRAHYIECMKKAGYSLNVDGEPTNANGFSKIKQE